MLGSPHKLSLELSKLLSSYLGFRDVKGPGDCHLVDQLFIPVIPPECAAHLKRAGANLDHLNPRRVHKLLGLRCTVRKQPSPCQTLPVISCFRPGKYRKTNNEQNRHQSNTAIHNKLLFSN